MRAEPLRKVFIDETGTNTKMTRARDAATGASVFAQRPPLAIGRPRLSSPHCAVAPDRARGHRRADGPGDLRDLRAHPARPNPAAGRHRHPGQSARSQESCRRTSHSRPRRLAHVSAVLQPRPRSDRNGLRQVQGASARQPCAPSTNSSAKSAISSPQDAQTTTGQYASASAILETPCQRRCARIAAQALAAFTSPESAK